MSGANDWTMNEIAVLEKYYGETDVGEIAEALDRTVNAIYKMAERQGLSAKRGPEPSKLSGGE